MQISEIVKGGVYEDSEGRRFSVIQAENDPSGKIIAAFAGGLPWPGDHSVRTFAAQMVRRVR
jgi:hypothetical protein